MQQREQRILQKLAEAREAQAGAMTRFIQARARVMQVEARLKALRARLDAPPVLPVSPSIASSPSTDGLSCSVPDQAVEASVLAINEQEIAMLVLTPADDVSILEPVSEDETASVPMSADDVSISEPVSEGEDDDDDTRKQVAIRPKRSANHQPEDEEVLLAVISTLRKNEQTVQEAPADGHAEDETSATDITAKIPVIRRARRDSQESA